MQTLRDIAELGREGETRYVTDGTGYAYPDGAGRAVQVWQCAPHRAREIYCLLSEWPESPAYRRITRPKKELREARPSFKIGTGIISARII